MGWHYVSRGYDNKYLESGEECGGDDVTAKCDVLQACGVPDDSRKHGVNDDISEGVTSRRYYRFASEAEAKKVMNCFFDHKRAVDKEMSDNFELAFESLKVLLQDNINALPVQEAREQAYLHKWLQVEGLSGGSVDLLNGWI